MTAGGKGANLGEMTANGITVPKGFVITAEAYRMFIRENGLEEWFQKELEQAGTNEEKLLAIAKKFRQQIRNGKLPKAVEAGIRQAYEKLGNDMRVAVRSSATAEDLPDASFAGQQETYLNVRGIEDVFAQVRNCYASLWGNRAVCYRSNQGYDQFSVALAVVIQQMIESEKAGVIFTVNPVSQNPEEMQINASYGLGESVVSGKVTADSYICTKNGTIKSTAIGSKETQIIYGESHTVTVPVKKELQSASSLNEQEIKELCKEAIRVEKHYGSPMDIEWAIQEEKVYILQARAITTLKGNNAEEKLIGEYLKNTKIKGMMKTEDFSTYDITQCGAFIEYSLTLIERLTYDRFKYALFPSALAKERTKLFRTLCGVSGYEGKI